MNVVPPSGPQPSKILLIGDSPNREDWARKTPFSGKIGEEQESYLRYYGTSARTWRKWNVVNEWLEGNQDPTSEQIAYWTPRLIAEIKATRPELIVAVGRVAARWFLGDDVDMEMVHGVVHAPGEFDSSRVGRVPKGAVILPIYHPAAGFYDANQRAVIDADYAAVAEEIKNFGGSYRAMARELYRDQGDEVYQDGIGDELAELLEGAEDLPLALDTEGTPENPWSIQISVRPGEGWVLRCSDLQFEQGIAAIQEYALRGNPIVLHNGMYDIGMCRAMGLDLRNPSINLYDTMYAAFLLRTEPQGLKPLLWRWCGMLQKSYSDTVGKAGEEKQLTYLYEILSRAWPKPEPRVIEQNDGSVKIYKPQGVDKRVLKILSDYDSGKVNKDGEPTDLLERWEAVDEELRRQVEAELGPMPIGGLEDIPLDEAIKYSGRDADGTLRLYYALSQELEARGLSGLMSKGMETLPVFEEMQSTGLTASRSYFLDLKARMTQEMAEIQAKLSSTYYGGKPFNPGSPKQTGNLLRRRGLEGIETTPTGEMSTSKRSIEHLRFTDPAIAQLFAWRERQHLRDSYCEPVLAKMPREEDDPDGDIYPIRCQIKPTRTHTRRLATADPNLLGIPTRTELGALIRKGFKCRPGRVIASWDLSQIEMRVMAHFSQDPMLLKFFREGRDIHRETAAIVRGCAPEEVTDRQRSAAKAANFGMIYIIGAKGLHTQLWMQGLTDWEVNNPRKPDTSCQHLIDKILRDVFKEIPAYWEQVAAETRKTGVSRTHDGMPRPLPGIRSRDGGVSEEALRHAVSQRIQGTAQDMIQNSIRWLRPIVWDLQQSGMGIEWLMEVHDEILMGFEEEHWEMMNELVLEGLTEHSGVELRVPIKASGAYATTWGDLK